MSWTNHELIAELSIFEHELAKRLQLFEERFPGASVDEIEVDRRVWGQHGSFKGRKVTGVSIKVRVR